MLLEILIPTLNRHHELVLNLQKIQTYIKNYNCEDIVGVIISDNGSEENSYRYLEEFLKNSYSCVYKLFRQKSNIGIEANSLFLLEKATSKYVMILGDDDYFSEEFFRITIDYLKEGKVTGIIPNFYCVDGTGKRFNSFYRDQIAPDKFYNKNSLWLSEKGHQLSCISFMREGVLEAYKNNVRENYYPFMYFIAFNLARGEFVHVTREPFANTLIPKKNWDYSFDNLMGHVACVIDSFPYKDEKDKKKQVKKIINDNAGRYCNRETYRHPIKLLQKINSYDTSDIIKNLLKKRYYMQMIKLPLVILKRILRNIQNIISEKGEQQ